MRKKIIILFLVLGLLFTASSARAIATRIHRIKTFKVQLEAPKSWKVKKEGREEYFKSKNVLRFEVFKIKLDKESLAFWKKSRAEFLASLAQSYTEALAGKVSVASYQTKNFKIKDYSAGRILYSGTNLADQRPIRIDQVMVVWRSTGYVMTAFVEKEKFGKVDKDVLVPVFKSFKKY